VEVKLALDTNANSAAARTALFAQLRRQGTPVPTNDLWIAALVLQHDLVLCTSDTHFDKLPQIARA
jgi:predicted nucleic acid-binding protein